MAAPEPVIPAAAEKRWSHEIPVRRRTRAVRVGDVWIGGSHPILIQSMTVSDTLDTETVVREIHELAEAGCPLVRLTAPSLREAENLRVIRRRLAADGIRLPLVADIHFTPNAALLAAEIVEKVRINPGNYADRKRFEVRGYSDSEYTAELERIAERFRPLVRKLKENGVALRIGTNHGSLSDRIMNRYGDTPEGMVESALEFVRVCEAEGYREIVLSMKSSIPSVMIAAYRLLVRRMDAEGMDYPLHIGVTEAGDGLEGRIKSAVGIGALLADGIGDTIRVSLTEDSRHEIPAARAILEAVRRETRELAIAPHDARIGNVGANPATLSDPPALSTGRRRSVPWVLGTLTLGGDAPVRVEERIEGLEKRIEGIEKQIEGVEERIAASAAGSLVSEFVSFRPERARSGGIEPLVAALEEIRTDRSIPVFLEWGPYEPSDIHLLEPLLSLVEGVSLSPGLEQSPARLADGESANEKLRLLARLLLRRRLPVRWRLPATASPVRSGELARALSHLCHDEGLNTVGFLCEPGPFWINRTRAAAEALAESGDLLFLEVPAEGPDPAILAGSLLSDGIGDALCLVSDSARGEAGVGVGEREEVGEPWPQGGRTWIEDPIQSSYALLQACRLRLTRAEFIACPSCGRTLFNLQTTTARIRARTDHLRGVKIAIMGCVVNGPGEMADADFGYVGSGLGRVDLYVGKAKVQPNVPEHEAADRLVELIRENGRWIEPAEGPKRSGPEGQGPGGPDPERRDPEWHDP